MIQLIMSTFIFLALGYVTKRFIEEKASVRKIFVFFFVLMQIMAINVYLPGGMKSEQLWISLLGSTALATFGTLLCYFGIKYHHKRKA
ncbi:MAG: hypothetical protein V4490_08365 [Pseudomonadota bacterium]